jgi:peptidoglycan/LPS O-acetylase OafA/YrhL
MAAVGVSFPATYFSDFLVGTILAMLFAENRLPKFSNWTASGVMLAGLYLFCFSAAENHAIHAPIKALLPAGETAHFVWDVSAALIIMVLLGNPFLCALFSKKWAVWLGLLSFPMYLLHVPIMLSAGAVSFIRSADALGTMGALLVAGAVTIGLTLVFALPLVWLDRHWTHMLGRMTGRWLKPRPMVAAPD